VLAALDRYYEKATNSSLAKLDYHARSNSRLMIKDPSPSAAKSESARLEDA